MKGKDKAKGSVQGGDSGGSGSQGETDQVGPDAGAEAGIPTDIAKAYLERLGAEVLERAKML